MRWRRRHRRLGSWLALAALALQIVLSFGHVHFEGIGRGLPIAANGAQVHASRTGPVQRSAVDLDDYCAICASIYLTANSFVPQAPRLPVPSVSQAIAHRDRLASVSVAARRTPFQSRAPPPA